MLFDQALSARDAYPGAGHLLSYAAGQEHISAAGARQMVSGASYLSRHGLHADDPRVLSVHERSVRMSSSEWKAPESTAARISTPTLLLIGTEDRVVGRLASWRDSSEVYGRGRLYYEPLENIARLDDLLKLADRADETSDFVSTTTKVLPVDGGRESVTFQINDPTEAYVLQGFSPGVLTVRASGPGDVRLSLVLDGATVASATNALDFRISRAHANADRAVLKLTGAVPDRVQGGSSCRVAEVVCGFFPGSGNDEVSDYLGFEVAEVLETLPYSDATTFTVKRTSGRLPDGLKLSFDSATGQVVVRGRPRKEGRFDFTYTVTRSTGNGRISAEPVPVTMMVADPRSVNPCLGVACTWTVPLLAMTAGATNLVGVVSVRQGGNGNLTVRVMDASGNIRPYRGRWSVLSRASGVARAVLKSGARTLALELTPEGMMSAVAGDARGAACSAAGADASFAGYYTVVMDVEEDGGGSPYAGSGYAMLSISKAGNARLGGAFPNGERFSLRTAIAIDPSDPEYAFLPVFYLRKGTALAALFRIHANGSLRYADPSAPQTIRIAAGVAAEWRQGTDSAAALTGYGAFYVKRTPLADWLRLFGLESASCSFAGREFPGITFAVNAYSGQVSGKLSAEIGGERVEGVFKGVLTPDWQDCGCTADDYSGSFDERPFAAGYLSCKIGQSGRKKSVTLPFSLVAR